MPLLGRDTELKDLGVLADGYPGGAGFLITGEPGVGKSALVAEAVSLAATASAGPLVLRTAGTEAERDFPYAAVQRALFPLRREFDALPERQFEALTAALGPAGAGGEPSVFHVGLAVLTLLAEAATERPVLVVAEDAQWLDPASAQVLAFVARRIHTEPVALVATLRDGEGSVLADAALTALRLDPLPTPDAAALLTLTAPDLPEAERARILTEARGNPLALIELPSAGRDAHGGPLTERLERAFLARGATLPGPTRTALLVTALAAGGTVTETLAATTVLTGSPAGRDLLTPAVDARLIDLDGDTVTFRHPLIRSALLAAAPEPERRQAHRALAESVTDPDRRGGHRAAAAAGPDDEVAADLEALADRARHRSGAVAALERAAALSVDTDARARRLLRAAETAVDAGRRDTAERLLRTARALPLTADQEATASWVLTGFDDGVREDPSRITELADLATAVAASGHRDAAARILWGAAMRCFWSDPGQATLDTLLAVADALPVPADDPRLVAVTAYVAPFTRGAPVIARLRALAATTGADPEVDRFLGSAALQVGAFDLAAHFAGAAAPGLRDSGRLGLLPRALSVQAWSLARLGDLTGAAPAAAEAAALAAETGQPFMQALAVAVQAEIAALRGEYTDAAARAAEAERIGLARGARPVLATVQLARGLAALGEGRPEDALSELSRLHDPRDPSYTPALRGYFLAELAEAAVRVGDTDRVRVLLDDLEPAPTPSPALRIGARYARALLAGEDAETHFTAALAADLTVWPAERARLHLAYGEWLRRQRRIVDSRTQLRAARRVYDALGFTAWSDRARVELRSAGETSPNRDPDARDRLTPHELSIAQLAAQGLTNREIGQKLFLSHRTVSTHLHRIFPKLGVSSRTELAVVLTAGTELPPP